MKSHSGPTWIIKSEPRPEYVAPPRKSLKSAADARKVVERLYTADCARREERVQANAKAYFRPATRRRRTGKKAVRSFLSSCDGPTRSARSDSRRFATQFPFSAERGVERTARTPLGCRFCRASLRLLDRRPDAAPTASTCELFRGPQPPAAVVADVWRSARAPARRALVDNLLERAAADRRPGYTSRCARPRSARTAPRGAHAPDGAVSHGHRGRAPSSCASPSGNCDTGRNARTSHHPAPSLLRTEGDRWHRLDVADNNGIMLNNG